MASVTQRVLEQYPSLKFLLNDPEVGRLLRDAVDPNKGFSSQTFQAKLMETRWWRTKSEAQRTWAITAATDPGEAKMQRHQYAAEIVTTAARLGVKLSTPEVKWITEVGLSRGYEPGGARMMGDILRHGRKAGKVGAGAVNTAARAVRNLETSQWMREPPRRETEYWGEQIALGRKTLEDFNAAAAHSAGRRFPHMAAQIRAGMTVAQAIGPMVEAYAREMDWDPQGLMSKIHTDPKHTGLLGIRDPKSRKMRLPTEHEAAVMARRRGDWWGTTRGREADAAMTSALLETFGRRK